MKSFEETARLFSVTVLLIFADRCAGLRLTNMTAPALQDPRHDMSLHCRFDMGGEDLYAVKWYKDDHEFFRYTPGANKTIMQFPVAGVTVENARTRCMRDGCDLLLTDLSRQLSSGAYRCEVSSEAPAFRLASQTHNVTVAAVPTEKPVIEGVAPSYSYNDQLSATCTSGLGDPRPVLTWYINNVQQQTKSRDITSGSYIENYGDRIRLKRTTSHLLLTLSHKFTQNRAKTALNISCVSSNEGISPAVAPPLITTRTIEIVDPNSMVNNEKFTHSASAFSSSSTHFSELAIVTLMVWWC